MNRAYSWLPCVSRVAGMFGFIPGWAEISARKALAQLHDRIGGPGMAAAAIVPGLAAAVDQHAAAVRDILATGVENSATADRTVLLARYVNGLLDQAREMGWRFRAPAFPVGWTETDWVTTRLLAVCQLAKRVDQPLVSETLGDIEPIG